jgi:hypothetical protein
MPVGRTRPTQTRAQRRVDPDRKDRFALVEFDPSTDRNAWRGTRHGRGARATVRAARVKENANRKCHDAANSNIPRADEDVGVPGGQVLQMNARVGEYAEAGPLATPLLLFGNVDTLRIRVDVDENEAWRIHGGAVAKAMMRGKPESLYFPAF